MPRNQTIEVGHSKVRNKSIKILTLRMLKENRKPHVLKIFKIQRIFFSEIMKTNQLNSYILNKSDCISTKSCGLLVPQVTFRIGHERGFILEEFIEWIFHSFLSLSLSPSPSQFVLSCGEVDISYEKKEVGDAVFMIWQLYIYIYNEYRGVKTIFLLLFNF